MSSLTITGIQSDLRWKDRDSNLKMFEEKINSIKDKTEIVILPEMFSTGFFMDPGPLAETMEGETVKWMSRIATEKKIILTGSVIINDSDQYFNRLIWMLPGGKYGYYDKRHLFAFAGEDFLYSNGNKRLISSVKGWKINLLICYDLRFPVWSRQSPEYNNNKIAELEYDLIIYVANWPEKRIHAWRTLLQARAIENQCYVVGVNRVGNDGNNIFHNGNSMVVDPLGEVLCESINGPEIFTRVLQKERLEEVRKNFPFWKDADRFLIES